MASLDIFYKANTDKFNYQPLKDTPICDSEQIEKLFDSYLNDCFNFDTINILEGDFLLYDMMKNNKNPYEFLASYLERMCINECEKIQTVQDLINFNNKYTKGIKNIRSFFKCLKNYLTNNNSDLIYTLSSYYFYKNIVIIKINRTFINPVFNPVFKNFELMITLSIIISHFKTFYEKNKGLFEELFEEHKYKFDWKEYIFMFLSDSIEETKNLNKYVNQRLNDLIIKIQKKISEDEYEKLANQIYDLVTIMPIIHVDNTKYLIDYNKTVCKRILNGSNLDLEMKILRMIHNKYKSSRILQLSTLEFIKDINETNYVKNILNNTPVKIVTPQFSDITFNKEFVDFKFLRKSVWNLSTEQTFNYEFLKNFK